MSQWSVTRYDSIDACLAVAAGHKVRVAGRSSVAGGCISGGSRLELTDGSSLFLKRSSTLPVGMFAAEAEGLMLLQNDHIRVPRPYGWGSDAGASFLLMEYVDSAPRSPDYDRALGRGLARLHRERTESLAGLGFDNYIGSTPQRNTRCDSWIEFFAIHRLSFQAELARSGGLLDAGTAAEIERLIGRLGELLPDTERKSLIHGDLWGGNVMTGPDGLPALIDPAVYFGHREADVAMTELFGGFSRAFYAEYNNEWPLDSGYAKRSDLYNLYHMMNHLNIFGGSYLGSVRSIVRRYA